MIFINSFFPKLSNQEPKDLSNWIILDIWVILSLISVDLILANAFIILVVCLVVRNNSFGNSSSSNFFNLNIPVLCFAEDFWFA